MTFVTAVDAARPTRQPRKTGRRDWRITVRRTRLVYGNGVDALFEPEFDSNTRVAIATALVDNGVSQPHVLELQPKADGVLDFVQKNWNDWEGIDADICRTLKSAGAQVNCKAWRF